MQSTVNKVYNTWSTCDRSESHVIGLRRDLHAARWGCSFAAWLVDPLDASTPSRHFKAGVLQAGQHRKNRPLSLIVCRFAEPLDGTAGNQPRALSDTAARRVLQSRGMWLSADVTHIYRVCSNAFQTTDIFVRILH